MMPALCTACGLPFTADDPPFLLRPTGKVYHRLCAAAAVSVWVEYAELPGWKRALVRVLARARRARA